MPERNETVLYPDYRDRQIILLLKGHYDAYPNVTLESLYSQWYDIPLDRVAEVSVMTMLLESYDRLCSLGAFRVVPSQMIHDLFHKGFLITGEGGHISPRAVIDHIKGLYVTLQTKDATRVFIDLGEIDLGCIDEGLSARIDGLTPHPS